MSDYIYYSVSEGSLAAERIEKFWEKRRSAQQARNNFLDQFPGSLGSMERTLPSRV